MEPKDIENPIAERDFRDQLKYKTEVEIAQERLEKYILERIKTALTDLEFDLDLLKDVVIILQSSDKEVYVNDEQRIGYQKGAKWMRSEIKKLINERL